jgi:hypothetical protein
MLETTRWNFYTRDAWNSRVDAIIGTFPTRFPKVLEFFKGNNWLHSLQPVTFSKSTGTIIAGEKITITNPNAGTTTYYTTDGSDVVLDNGISPKAKLYTTPLTFSQGKTTLKARAFTNGNFGPITEATYTAPAAATINITGLNYSPKAATSKLADSLEFVLVTNYGAVARSVAGDSIAMAINFGFPAGTTLAAGETVMIAKFPSKYPSVTLRKFTWATGKFADGGERVIYKTATGTVLNDFSYLPTAPWATSANGGGDYLKLKATNLDNSVATNWVATPIPSATTFLARSSDVNFLTVQAQREGGKAVITWVPSRQNSDDIFELEKWNADKQAFEVLKTYKGGSSFDNYFQYADENPVTTGENLYRVAFYPSQSTAQYSDVLKLDFSFISHYTLYPNPARELVAIELQEVHTENITIKIVNMYGQVAQKEEIQKPSGTILVNTESLQEGQYILLLEVKGKGAVAKKLHIAR